MKDLKKLILNGDTYIIRDENAVVFETAQPLTDAQKQQSRENIGAAGADDMASQVERLEGLIAAGGSGGSGGSGDGTGSSSITVDAALDPNSTNPVQNKVIAQLFQQAQATLAGLTPDAALNSESTNPIQNKAVYAALMELSTGFGTVLEQLAGSIPDDTHINSLIDAKLGVIENGTY